MGKHVAVVDLVLKLWMLGL